jgi:uncharacterized membrane protein YqgA involved in biofilm formation
MKQIGLSLLQIAVLMWMSTEDDVPVPLMVFFSICVGASFGINLNELNRVTRARLDEIEEVHRE